MAEASRDENYVPTLIAVSNADGVTPVKVYADPVTHRLLVNSTGGGGGGTPGGSSGQLQYNNAGAFGGISGATSNGVFITLTAPRFADLGFIADQNGNEMLAFNSVASAVNYLEIENGATGNPPHIRAKGDDTNIGLHLVGKGTGEVSVCDATDETKRMRFNLANNTTNVITTLRSNSTAARTIDLPDASGTLLYSGGPLGTPSSGTVTNLTGTASININGTVGATTPNTGVFTTLVAGSATSLLLGTAGSAVGSIGFRNATSGTITLAPVTGALGTVTLSLPAATDTLVGRATTDTLTNKTLTSPVLNTGVSGTAIADITTTNTGTSATTIVTPDGLAGSVFGVTKVGILVSDPLGSAITTGDGKAYARVPVQCNGMNLVGVAASLSTVSSSGTVTVMIRRSRRTSATARTSVDMLSTALTIDVNEFDSIDATTAAVINTANDDLITGDQIYVDIDGAGTGAKGLFIELQYQLP